MLQVHVVEHKRPHHICACSAERGSWEGECDEDSTRVAGMALRGLYASSFVIEYQDE